ncbi:unnamed protein product, partial [Ixodes pacificus]
TDPSLDDIKLNYQELALQWHPSKHRANKPTIQKFEELSRSYLVLTEGRESMDTILSPAKMCEVFIKAFDLEGEYPGGVATGRDTGCQTSNSAVAASQTSPARNNKGKSTAAVQTLPVENSNVAASGFDGNADVSGRPASLVTVPLQTLRSGASGTASEPQGECCLASIHPRTGDNIPCSTSCFDLSTPGPTSPHLCSPEEAREAPRQSTSKGQLLAAADEPMDEVGLRSDEEALLSRSRRKQRQKQQNAGHEDKDDDKKGSGSSSDLDDEKPEVEEEDLDLNSAFVVMSLARKAAKASGAVPKKSVQVREDAVAQSRKLAEEGFELCHLSRYKDAISMFSQAIKLCPDDHTSYGNRSFCYCILERYDKALYDAEKAVSLQPTLAKGYFRRGKAQLGLQKYREAAESFKTVLSIDPECHEALTELHNVHIYELMGMGFTQEQADWALTIGGEDIQSAVDALCGNGNYKADTKMNPGNLDGLCSIWVGNIRPEVTEKMLRNLFHK